MLILKHDWGVAGYLGQVGGAYPSARFVMGHHSLAYADVVNELENVYQCTCVPLGYRPVEDLVDRVDPKKIVFGSDLTDLDPALGIAPLACAEIARSAKRLILGRNMRRLLDALRPPQGPDRRSSRYSVRLPSWP